MKTLPLLLLLTLPLGVPAAPPSADDLLARSRSALQAGDAQQAVEAAEQAVAAAPERADLHTMLGRAYAQRITQVNFMQQAIMAGRMRGAFEKAVALDPEYLPARIGLVQFYAHAPAIAGGGRASAEREAEQVRQRDPYHGALEFAFIADKFGDTDRALEELATAAALRPKDVQPLLRLGALQEKLGHLDAARTHYRAALELEPALAPARKALERLEAPHS